MANLYYAIVVGSPNKDCQVFRKSTGLPFPSPMGTGMYINFTQGAFGKVAGYSHHESGDFYVFLIPMHEVDRCQFPDTDMDSCNLFGFTDEEFDQEEEVLLQNGWDLEESYIASYANPFHNSP